MDAQTKLTPRHLKALRTHYSLTQARAAALLGITRVTWVRWERGQSAMPPYMIFTLRGLVAHLEQQKEREEEK